MTRLTLQGTPVYTEGHLPAVGHEAPKFILTGKNLDDFGLEQFGMQRKLLNIVPSLEMPSCAASLRRFNDHARQRPGVVVLSISHDLPFSSQSRIDASQLDRVVALSTFRSPHFARAYGVDIVSGPLKGLTARAVLVLDGHNRVLHGQLVREITDEPDYAAAVAALEKAC
ncbi:thiol peroxidase [Methylibium sp.]|uniref:thiol peroxidase n=1 Tax=Methylibium sp. TaxID=2067992 RepID=UPI003D13EFAE